MANEVSEFDVKYENAMAKINMPLIRPPTELQKIINDTGNKALLATLNPRDTVEYAILLNSYALYLTMAENKLLAEYNLYENTIKRIVGENVAEVNGYGFNEKDTYIRANEPHAKDLESKKTSIQVEIDSMKYLSQKFQMLAENLKNLSFAKKIESRNY